MYLIIIGAGDIGTYLARLLLDEGHDAIVVDKDPEVCKKISTDLDIEAINGDGTDPKVLEKLDVKTADAIIALSQSDETNMIASIVAKELGARQVAARIEKIEYNESVLKKLGIDVVIHPKAAAAGYIAEVLTNPAVLDLAFISKGHAKILEFEAKNSKVAGKKISEISMPEGSSIIAVINSSDEVQLPKQDMPVSQSDAVLVISKKEVTEKVKKMFQA